jgi:hypothetical protein
MHVCVLSYIVRCKTRYNSAAITKVELEGRQLYGSYQGISAFKKKNLHEVNILNKNTSGKDTSKTGKDNQLFVCDIQSVN